MGRLFRLQARHHEHISPTSVARWSKAPTGTDAHESNFPPRDTKSYEINLREGAIFSDQLLIMWGGAYAVGFIID